MQQDVPHNAVIPHSDSMPVIDTIQATSSPADALVGVTVLTIDGTERTGRLVSICDDLMNAKVATNPAPAVGEAVVFYLDSGMRFVATCTGVDEGVATLAMKLSHHRATRRRERGVRHLREDEKRIATDDACSLTDMDGKMHECRVLDISLTGIFVGTDARLTEGEIVKVGKAAAEVVRTAPGGYGMRLIKAGQRPVANPTAKCRADRFAIGRAPVDAVA